MNQQRQQLANTKCWIIKVGSSLLTDSDRKLNKDLIATWVEQIVALRDRGTEIVLVSSGAVAEGMVRLNWRRRPHALHELQAAAAVGQMGLIQAYESCFLQHGLHTAQILLTHDDLIDRRRYLNARSTLRTLLKLNIVPVINENDSVAAEEIRFGDNDTLAALVANLIEANLLVLLTDQAGMYEQDPKLNKSAKLIHQADAGDPRLETMAANGKQGRWGRGGMLTKVRAATRAARSGTATLIADGRDPGILLDIQEGREVGTLIMPRQGPVAARKQWLAGQLKVQGKLVLDDGAVQVLKSSGRSLLPVGVIAVEGKFARGEVVACYSVDGCEIARGLVNYNAEEAAKIMRQPSDRIEELLGYVDEPELIHRDNLALL